ncbi:MAG: hypothetical protein RRA32_01305 [bacterium]|nr:hypothetical protein [bacterium]
MERKVPDWTFCDPINFELDEDRKTMEPGIENFAGVIIQNEKGEVLLVRKVEQYAYAIPWCRVTPGKTLRKCLVDRVMDLTGLSIQPVFLGPNEHIEESNHFISFDHTARIDSGEHHYIREGLDHLWTGVDELLTVPLVALTRQILERYFLDHGIEPGLSSEPKGSISGN